MIDIAKYVSGFTENSRDAVVDQIVKGKLLRQAIEMPGGKAIINSAIDDIHRKIMTMVMSCGKPERNYADIETLATEIYIIHGLIRNWAQILVDAERHQNAMDQPPPASTDGL